MSKIELVKSIVQNNNFVYDDNQIIELIFYIDGAPRKLKYAFNFLAIVHQFLYFSNLKKILLRLPGIAILTEILNSLLRIINSTNPSNFYSKVYDFIIVGSGAGGSTAFKELSGKHDVLLIEEGTLSSDYIKTRNAFEVFKHLYRNQGFHPALGIPSVAIGEGKCLGGSTEINGGLFWRTPEHILKNWQKQGSLNLDILEINKIFNELEEELKVTLETPVVGSDRDSEYLVKIAQDNSWKFTYVKRMVNNCIKANKCPSGCPSSAKMTMSKTFIAQGIANGGQVLTGWKAEKILSAPQNIKIFLKNNLGQSREIVCNNLIVSCGAIETQKLLMKSKLIKKRIGKIQFHANAKIIVKFNDKIFSQKGTIMNVQLQEFLEDGFLFMPSNFDPTYLAMAYNGPESDFFNLKHSFDSLAIYTCQFQCEGKLLNIKFFSNTFLLLSYLKKSDIAKIKKYMTMVTKALFDAGAEEIYLPILGTRGVTSATSAEKIINKSSRLKFILSTVHLMSSVPLPNNGSKNSPIDFLGRLKSNFKIQILDASILPTSTIESPQGTIMAMTRLLLRKNRMQYN